MNDKQEDQVQLCVRYPESFTKRLDKIAEKLSEPGKRFTRVEVLRMASYRGLEAMEKADRQARARPER